MTRPRTTYALDLDTSSFVIKEYNWAPAFSNFLPGIAGAWGIPLWAYYVNRGQAMTSVGVRDKDGQILEFYSLNKAVMRIEREGFRTFVRIDGGPVYEPFRRTERNGITQTMIISSAELVLRERNDPLGLEIEVVYFTLPNLPVAAMARQVRLRNLAARRRRVEWLDGAARIIPFGVGLERSKAIPRHIEAMMGVWNFRGVPLFRLKQNPEDLAQVGSLSGGHFYLAAGTRLGQGLVVDPDAVFGDEISRDRPWRFEREGAPGVLAATAYRDNKTPAAFVVRTDQLAAGAEVTQSSVLGHVPRDADLLPLLSAMRSQDFFHRKRSENAREVAEIGGRCFTVSSSPTFDAYAQQNFLDNVVRGGMPRVFQTARGPSACYLFGRRHGGLERDYHDFVVEPTYLSQGNGFYRDVLQNRRSDTLFFPEVEDANLVTFLNLSQLDGYNPQSVDEVTYRVADQAALGRWLRRNVSSAPVRADLRRWIQKSFSPGQFVMRLEAGTGRPVRDRERVAREVLAFCAQNEVGSLHEGFWSDHWHYNFDLLDAILMVFPDRLEDLLVGRRFYTFFDNPDVVLPRSEKTVAVGAKIRCYGAVIRDGEKERYIRARNHDPYTVRTRYGRGTIHRTTLLVKLLCLVTNRLGTLDPAGTGIEMEASKPGWNDALNGLPGLFGSGLSELLELRRALRFMRGALDRIGRPASETLPVYEELAGFLRALRRIIRRRLRSRAERAAFRYWDSANTVKERYRDQTRLGVSGLTVDLSFREIRGFLADAETLLDATFRRPTRAQVMSPGGVPYTYFLNEIVKHRPLSRRNHQGFPLVKALGFRQRPVKLFLEGAVHWMKDRPEEAADIYRAVRRSGVFDRKLAMYKTCEDMTGETTELGRSVGAYPRGWMENESIYLHMHYKYLLEVLRAGLYAEFWKDARTGLIPFLDPAVYGRSTLEGASFVVSSAYPDERFHGRAFQPRLSGMTTEFISMWILALVGSQPFRVATNGNLTLTLEPRLPDWLFTERQTTRRYHDPLDGWGEVSVPKDALAFKLLGRVLVVYRNPRRRPTWGARGVQPIAYRLEYRSGQVVELGCATVAGAHAEAVREGAVRRIDVTLR